VFKILHTADSHFQQNRLDECVSNADFIVEYALEHNPDVIVHAGDLFHKNTQINSKEYLAAIDFISNLSYIAPVIIIRGNHDPEDSLKVFNKMHGVYSFGDLDTVTYNEMRDVEYPAVVEFGLIPYQKTTSMEGDTVGDAHLNSSKDLKKFISNFAKKKSDLKIIVAHISVAGAELANSERILGNEVMLSPDDFTIEGINAAMLGHIHRNDQDILKGKPVAYSGAHYRTRFDEEMQPGFCFWTFDGEKFETVNREFIKTPARDMVKFELSIEETREYMSSGKFPFELLPNADMKVIFSVPEGMASKLDKEKFKKDMDLKLSNSTIKVSTIVEPKSSVRSEKIAKMQTKSEIFEEWANVSKVKLTKSIKEKFNELVESFDD